LIEFTVGNDLFESVFLISSQLTNEAIIGCQLLKEYGISINFGRGTFSYVRGGVLREYTFAAQDKLQEVAGDDQKGTRNSVCPDTPYPGQRTLFPADIENIPARAVNSCFTPSQTETEGCLERER
jgi:hypothetical protein